MQATSADPVTEIASRSRVLTRSSVVGLIGCGLLIVAAVLWALVARAPETIVGEGVILPSTGFAEAGTGTRGVVDRVLTSPGQEVVVGDALVSVRTNAGELLQVRAPVSGEVVYVYARPGRRTALGEPLVILQENTTQIARAFIPANQAELIVPGMQAWVSPSSAPRGQYGFIIGSVASVAPAPVTREQLMAVLGDNTALADYVLSAGPVQEITVDLNTADTSSGYAWTIGEGPDFAISSSTMAQVAVVVSQRSVAAWLTP